MRQVVQPRQSAATPPPAASRAPAGRPMCSKRVDAAEARDQVLGPAPRRAPRRGSPPPRVDPVRPRPPRRRRGRAPGRIGSSRLPRPASSKARATVGPETAFRRPRHARSHDAAHARCRRETARLSAVAMCRDAERDSSSCTRRSSAWARALAECRPWRAVAQRRDARRDGGARRTRGRAPDGDLGQFDAGAVERLDLLAQRAVTIPRPRASSRSNTACFSVLRTLPRPCSRRHHCPPSPFVVAHSASRSPGSGRAGQEDRVLHLSGRRPGPRLQSIANGHPSTAVSVVQRSLLQRVKS